MRVVCCLLLAGCATQRDVVIGKARSAYERLGEVRETTTIVTVGPSGTTTQRTEKVTTTSAVADLVKSLGGVAVQGAK